MNVKLSLSMIFLACTGMAQTVNSRELQELSILNSANASRAGKVNFVISFNNLGNDNLQNYAFKITYTGPGFNVPFPVYLRPSELGRNGKSINRWIGILPPKGTVKVDLVYLGKSRLSWQELTYNLANEKAITLNITAAKNNTLEVRKI